ncbi:MAG: DUF2335 domain-containing protein [Gammaproteobacteria bacterium]
MSKKHHTTQIQQTVTAQKIFSGPIPSPEVLAGYEKLENGLAARIVKMAEDQAQHRHNLETKQLELQYSLEEKKISFQTNNAENNHTEIKRGQIFGFLFGLSAIAAGVVAIIYDHAWAAGIFNATGLGIIITAFIRGRENSTHTHENQKSDKDMI